MSTQINLFDDGALISYTAAARPLRLVAVDEDSRDVHITVTLRRNETDETGPKVMVRNRNAADAVADCIFRTTLPEVLVHYESMGSVIRRVRWCTSDPVPLMGDNPVPHLYFESLDDAAAFVAFCAERWGECSLPV